ncbi:MAG: hypothetical protein NTX13_03465 [Acidobacteria bacterium]|nr:hypothetical protein [Acidobacteriota bacterium]
MIPRRRNQRSLNRSELRVVSCEPRWLVISRARSVIGRVRLRMTPPMAFPAQMALKGPRATSTRSTSLLGRVAQLSYPVQASLRGWPASRMRVRAYADPRPEKPRRPTPDGVSWNPVPRLE